MNAIVVLVHSIVVLYFDYEQMWNHSLYLKWIIGRFGNWEGVNWLNHESVSRHKIWVQKLSMVQSKFLPAHDQKIDCGDHLSDHIPISTMSNHTLYLWRDIRRVEMLWNGWIGLQTNNLGVKGRDPSRYFHLPWLKSWGVVMVVGDKFQSQPCLTI